MTKAIKVDACVLFPYTIQCYAMAIGRDKKVIKVVVP